jgi:3-phosphoshikimate 1-carboxyvinyltransferase
MRFLYLCTIAKPTKVQKIMRNKIIIPSAVDGIVSAPSSKSHAQRLIAAALLANGVTILKNLTLCGDITAALHAAKTLGAGMAVSNNEYTITSRFFENHSDSMKIFVGESGFLARTITPIAALLGRHITIDGCGTLMQRPMNGLIDALHAFGMQIDSNDGRLPLSIHGKLHGGMAEIDGSSGSQVLSGLLMALPLTERDSLIYVKNLQSIPYIDLTIDVLAEFGITIQNNGYQEFRIAAGQKYHPHTCYAEGDWSAASCLLAAGCIAGRVSVSGLSMRSRQADIAIVDAIKLAGGIVLTKFNDSPLITTQKSFLHAFDYDASHCPDLFPALTALAAYANGVSHILGAGRLLHKESNRAQTLKEEYAKLGVTIELQGDAMHIHGGAVSGGIVNARGDHRIAMSLAAAALCADSPVTIEDSDCVEKSYPQFWEHFFGLLKA